MIFVETVRLGHVVRWAHRPRAAYVRTWSLGARVAAALLRRCGVAMPPIQRLELGHLQVATGARQAAFDLAEGRSGHRPEHEWAAAEGERLGIDLALLVTKLHFEREYDRCLFVELMLRYAAEHPDQAHECEVDAGWDRSQELRCRRVATVKVRRISTTLGFVAGVCALPLLVVFHWWRHGTRLPLQFDRALVCAVDGEQMVELFQRVFEQQRPLRFVTERQYAAAFSDERRQELGLQVLGLTAADARQALVHSCGVVFRALRQWSVLAESGSGIFRLWHNLLQGRALAVHGRNNTFVTFEHLLHVRAVRNEFLRAEGSRSVFVPKNAYVTYRQFPSEAWINYDVVGCSGAHAEELYRWKHAVTTSFVMVGAYDAHRRSVTSPASDARRQSLQVFAEGRTLITILSPGVSDQTLSLEVRLVELARQLSTDDHVRIAFRRKPVEPEAKFRNFYDVLEGLDRVWVTPPEFELHDYHEETALFVTSISTSACDLALRGAQVVFVDFLQTPDLYVPWQQVPAVVVDGHAAVDHILGWVHAGDDGAARQRHRAVMDEFRRCLGGTRPDFATYQAGVRAMVDGATA